MRATARRAGDGGALLRDHARPSGAGSRGSACASSRAQAARERVVAHLLMLALGADHAREPAALAEQRAAVEHPLHQARVEAEHRQRQAHLRRVLQVAGGDRLVLELGREARQQRVELVRPDRDHHRGVLAPQGVEVARALVQPQLAAVPAQPGRGRLGKQPAQVDARQQQVARARGAAERVAQHREEGAGRGARGRRVERRDAQRAPQVARDGALLGVAREQLVDAAVGFEAKAAPPQREHEAHGADALAKRQAARGEQPAEQPERGGQPELAQGEAAGVAQLERHAQQRVARHADAPHEAEQLAVGADQDMLAVVQRFALRHDPARAPAGDGPGLVHRDRHALRGERHRAGHAGVSGADDRYAASHVFQAIHSLRSGVSEVRRSSTRKPSRSISASSAR